MKKQTCSKNRRAWTLFVVLTLVLPSLGWAQEKKEAIGVGKAAGIGALLGLALGNNPIVGSISGAALGAAGGLIANTVVENQERDKAEKRQEAQQATQAQQTEAELRSESVKLEQEVEEAIGRDNYEGYKALRSCNRARASALAKAAATSPNEDYRITSIWLDAMIAVDSRDEEAMQKYFEEIVEKDPDIDTVQQASLKTDSVVLDMRQERRDLGIKPCR